MVRRDPHVTRLFGHVLDPHRDGHFPLPDEVVREMNALDAVEAATQSPLPSVEGVATARARVLDAVVSAAREGAPLPTAQAVVDAEIAVDEGNKRRVLYQEAIEKIESRLYGEITTRRDAIIVEHLRPRLDELLDAVRQVAERVEIDRMTREHLIVVAKEGDVVSTLDPLSVRYRAIYRAHEALTEHEFDEPRHFREFRNMLDVWPEKLRTRRPLADTPPAPPWPSDGVARLLWIVVSGAEPWLPLPAEEQAAMAAFQEQLAAEREASYAAIRGQQLRTT